MPTKPGGAPSRTPRSSASPRAARPTPCTSTTVKNTELKIDGYPLGVREDTTYDTIETQLSEGDYLVMYSDDIPETVRTPLKRCSAASGPSRLYERRVQRGSVRRNWWIGS